MRIFTKAVAAISIIAASVSVNAADLTTSGDGSVLLSVWQQGPNIGGGNDASVIVDTGLNFSDLFAIAGGGSVSVNLNSVFDVAGFLTSNITFATSDPFMNIVSGATVPGFNQLFSSNESFTPAGPGGAINVELNNSVNNTNNVTNFIPASGAVTSLNVGTFPNAADTSTWNENFGTAFTDIDNAFEITGTADPLGPLADGNVSGEMILFQTSTQGTLNGQPIQVNDFGGLYTFAYDLATGDLEFSAVPLPAAVWFLGSALIGLMGFSRRRAIAA